MREVVHTSQFKRDYKKKSRERGFDLLLSGVINRLITGESLDTSTGITRSRAAMRAAGNAI
jgi:mRNA-degrading endonuclease YafQ of YafQ-DinJ toxin-antitoxin module